MWRGVAAISEENMGWVMVAFDIGRSEGAEESGEVHEASLREASTPLLLLVTPPLRPLYMIGKLFRGMD